MIDYNTFPLVKFFRILNDKSLLGEITPSDFKALEDEWEERHPTPETIILVDAQKKVIIESTKTQRDTALFRLLLSYDKDPKEFYEMAGVKYHEDAEERFAYLTKEISKAKQKHRIFDAQLEQLQESIKENRKNNKIETTIVDIYEVLASFELAGISVGNYEEITLGRYDGLTKAFDRKIKQNGK